MSRARVAAIQKQIDALDAELTKDNAGVKTPEITTRIQDIKDELVKLHAEQDAE